jgi:ABC-type multidrug transport system ATPase subunit
MLEYLLRLKGVESGSGAKSLARELLAKVNLADAAKRRVKDYSGGMRQRLGIAQAIAGEPRLIIVDEPTAGLDPEERHRFYRLLAELAERRIVVLSTHIVEDVAVLCPRFAVIRQGQVVALTSPSEARRQLSGTIFEGDVPASELESLRRTRRVTQAILVEGKNRVRVWEPSHECPPGFEPAMPTLEDAYLVTMREGGVGGGNGAQAPAALPASPLSPAAPRAGVP